MDITEKEEKWLKDIIEKVLHVENAYLNNTVVSGDDAYKVSFGDYVIATSLYSIEKNSLPISRFIGRVIQIREKAGIVDTDIFMLRCPDGVLVPIENEVFMIVPSSSFKELEMFYKEHNLLEIDGKEGEYEYTINDKEPKQGFIIKAKE